MNWVKECSTVTLWLTARAYPIAGREPGSIQSALRIAPSRAGNPSELYPKTLQQSMQSKATIEFEEITSAEQTDPHFGCIQIVGPQPVSEGLAVGSSSLLGDQRRSYERPVTVAESPKSNATVANLNVGVVSGWVWPVSMDHHAGVVNQHGKDLSPQSTQQSIYRAKSTSNDRYRGLRVPARSESSSLGTENLLPPSSINPVGINAQNQLSLAFFDPLPFDEWPSLEDLGPHSDIFSVSRNSSLENHDHPFTTDPINATKASSSDRVAHSCPRESYEILRDLICPSAYLHAPETSSETVSAHFDFVLHFVRDAIDRLTRLLECSCARSGHRIMVHASIISRMLIWYQQAAGWTASSSGKSVPSALVGLASSSDTSSLPPSTVDANAGEAEAPTLAQTTGFVVTHVPVSMGTFSVEDQDLQAAVRNRLVLSELKNTANLIDLFISQDSSESYANGLLSLYTHLGAWLQAEQSRTVGILRTRLQAISANLDS
ncbi:hypothetical protein K431DRAFT_346044 [Polychaeton citri CBS 116435]|uniref:Aflatoxin regulatory protein domain-containing protein n=1 Tax=Polychaeton citri CBS 116435 TaxID=1314669 RepID=A0A9P4UN07_9PEZI|nr:hypothetical protein K431DRAFT_346044 [Polychaeton citri CBS 116435]